MGDAIRVFWAKVRAIWAKSEMDDDFNEELETHLDLLTAEFEKAGMKPQEARRAAILKVGGRETLREENRDSRGLPFLEVLAQDVKYAMRTLRRDKGFAIFAILIAGLGVGASCTVFSVVNTILIHKLPFKNPEQLAWIANHDDATNDMSGKTTQVDHFKDLRDKSQSFSDMAAYMAFYGVGDAKLIEGGEPERLTSVPVSRNFFPLLGVEPQLGRQFSEDEAKFNGPGAVMLSDGIWRRKFGADPHIVGRSLDFDGGPKLVVGVLPAWFDFSTVFTPGSRVDVFEAFPLTPETNKWGNTLSIVGRLKPAVNVQTAQAEATVLAKLDKEAHKERNDFDPKVSMLSQHVSGRLRPALFVLATAVGVVMLIVCANLSNLLLARGTTRQKEIAIRATLGAGKIRLIRQMLTESLILSFCGAIVGLIFAFIGTRVLAHLTSMSIPLLGEVHIDGTVLLFTLLIALATGLIFGLLPALQVRDLRLHETLKDANRGSSVGRGHAWVRNALVVSEIGLACVLVVGAGLLIRSFMRVLDVNMGFSPDRVAAVRVDPNASYKTQEQRNVYFTEVLRRVNEVQGIEAAGMSDAIPLGHNRSWGIAAKGVQYTPETYPEGFPRIISEGYFHAIGIPLREGRDFSGRDDKGTLNVIILNEACAETLWPGQDPIGKIVAEDVDRTVVGVVGNVHHMSLEEKSGNEFYIPLRQTGDYGSVDLVVRSSMSTSELGSRLREALLPIEPNLPTSNLRTMQSMIDRAVSPRRFVVILLGGFAAFALVLASLGIYAVISYSVSQRTQEIGIRMALGASSEVLQKSILLQTLWLAAIGVVGGIVGSWILARALSGMLFGVSPADPTTFAFMVLVLTGVACLAGYLPARRASQIDPMQALRID
ncbi:MAG TPA: ABC transporter permease [Candidatus Sulfotelmatobacter sp.]|nr:ABC transporter permease [Candidatus Sulfotelmatobacter sp.]